MILNQEGKGLYVWPTGKRYLGGFLADKMNGIGIMFSADGARAEHIYEDNESYAIIAAGLLVSFIASFSFVILLSVPRTIDSIVHYMMSSNTHVASFASSLNVV